MPERLQIYDSYKNATFGQTLPDIKPPAHDFSQQFIPREHKSLNFEDDFNFNPKKFFCKKHPSLEVEFSCEISEEFYCRKCAGEHSSHKTDRSLHKICLTFQEKLTELKLCY